MRITFILPMYLAAPAGGFKVVYEYANRLQARGHQVRLVHPRQLVPQLGLVEFGKSRLWQMKLRFKHRPLLNWFQLAAGVRFELVPDLRERFIGDAEVVVATAFNTAAAVAGYSARQGRKLYLIQGYESWQGDEAAVRASWQLPMQKIVISQWLYEQAVALGEADRTVRIPLGLDFTRFRMLTQPAARRVPQVAMLYHPSANKGFPDGLAALTLARAEVPALRASLFGTLPRPADLPAWCDYVQQPDGAALEALYNASRIFLNPSHNEGWGLPAIEALACGCALVSADNHGVRDFTVPDETALLVPIQRPALLAAQLVRLLNDDELRCRLAHAGHAYVQRFNWDDSVTAFETLLQ